MCQVPFLPHAISPSLLQLPLLHLTLPSLKSKPCVGFPRKPSKFYSVNFYFYRNFPFNNRKKESCKNRHLWVSHSAQHLHVHYCPSSSAFLDSQPVCISWASLLSSSSFFMANPGTIPEPEPKKDVYSVWGIPPENVGARMKQLMSGLRSEFGGPEFEPHITVVGAISLTADDAVKKLQSACEGLKAYNVTVDRVASGTFFYQCVYLLIHPTTEVVEPSDHCASHFGYRRPSPYMPHLSILYGDLTDEEKKKAQERAITLDDSLSGLSFQISRLALYKTDTEDKTLKSWEKIAECTLSPN